MKQKLTDQRIYLVPAWHAWLAENYSRVYLKVAIKHKDLVAPAGLPTHTEHVPLRVVDENGNPNSTGEMVQVEYIILNFGFEAIAGFYANDKGMGAKMRFGGKPTDVFIPYSGVLAVYSPDAVPEDQKMTIQLCGLYHDQRDLTVEHIAEEKAPTEEPKSRPNFLTRVK